jgi:MinD superfamily P-loop ATPase
MKQLVILSGKGGTGKTSVTAAFAHLAAQEDFQIRTVLADADVDAANLELVLAPIAKWREDFWGGQIAEIDVQYCSGCGICQSVCRFDAIFSRQNQPMLTNSNEERSDIYWVDPIACDGCAACVFQCPEEAICMQPQLAGEWFRSQSLRPAQENSGKLVTLVKQNARLLAMDEGYQLVLVDGPPGIGCPVISAISGADLVLVVTEPTIAGVHDMHRILQTTAHFGVQAAVCINKADIYPNGAVEIETFCKLNDIEMVGSIPFDITVTQAMVQGQPVTAYQPDSPSSRSIRIAWERIVNTLEVLT